MPKRELKLNYQKCSRCRKDRQNCTPKERKWPEERCDRCMKYGFSCSASRTAKEEAEDERKMQEERGEVPQRMVIRPYKELLEELDCLSFLQRGIDSFDVDLEYVKPMMREEALLTIEKVGSLLKITKEDAMVTVQGLKASKKFSEARVLCETAQCPSTQDLPSRQNERFIRETVEASKGLGLLFDALDNQACLVKAIQARVEVNNDAAEAILSSSEDEALMGSDRMDVEGSPSPERQELEVEITNMIGLYSDCAKHLQTICQRLDVGQYYEQCHPLLFHAIGIDCIPLVKRLSSLSSLTGFRDIFYRNAVHFVARSGSSRMLRALGPLGDSIQRQDILHRVPVFIAYKHGNLRIAKKLLKEDAAQGTVSYLDYGILHGHALGDLRINAFQLACLKGYEEEVRLLLREHPDPNEFASDDVEKGLCGITALQAACAEGRLEAVQVLCSDSRVNVNVVSTTIEHPLIIATRHGDRTVIEKLIDHYSNLEKSSTPQQPCGKAAGIVYCLIQHGADVNVADWKGWTPLMFAVLTDEIAIIKALLDNKADPNKKNESGWTALMMTAGRSSYWKPDPTLVANELVNHGADTNIRNPRGETAYDVAKRNGITALYELLFPLPNFGPTASSSS